MTKEFLLDAIGQMEDELVLEAAQLPARQNMPWTKVAGLAAALVLCVGLARVPGLVMSQKSADSAAPREESAGVTNGALMDGVPDFEYRVEEDSKMEAPAATQKAESAAESAPAQGVFEPVFRTEEGRYMLVGEELPLKAKLPDDAQYVGELVFTDPGEPVYPSVGTRDLVGCAVWKSADGEYLYIQNPAGGWLQATRSK